MHPHALPKGYVLRSPENTYVIQSVLGAGGFGITYRATTKSTMGNIPITVTVAIKEFFVAADCERSTHGDETIVSTGPAAQRIEAAKRDFMGEARRLNRISGQVDNIVRVNEVFEANSTAYYVMEYLEGESLKEYVNRRGRLALGETLALLFPVARALEGIHDRKLMHLDIKPANIMITHGEDGNLCPVVIDFGQSRHFDEEGELTSTMTAAAMSEGYAPIEQYIGISQFTPETDVYALAATILYCITGKRPPKATDITGKYVSEAAYSAGASDAQCAALCHALALQAPMRTPSFSALIGELWGAEGSANEPPRPPQPPTPPTPPAPPVEPESDESDRKKPVNIVMIIIFSVLVVLISIIAFLILIARFQGSTRIADTCDSLGAPVLEEEEWTVAVDSTVGMEDDVYWEEEYAEPADSAPSFSSKYTVTYGETSDSIADDTTTVNWR